MSRQNEEAAGAPLLLQPDFAAVEALGVWSAVGVNDRLTGGRNAGVVLDPGPAIREQQIG